MHLASHLVVQTPTFVSELLPCVRSRLLSESRRLTEQAISLSRDDTTGVRKRRALKAVFEPRHVLPAAGTHDMSVIPTGIPDVAFLSGMEWRDLLQTGKFSHQKSLIK